MHLSQLIYKAMFFFTLHSTIRIYCIYTHLHTYTHTHSPRATWLSVAPSNRILCSVWQRCLGNASSYTLPLSSLAHTHTPTPHASTWTVFPPTPFLRRWWIIHVKAVQQLKCRECQLERKACGCRDSPQGEGRGAPARSSHASYTPTNARIRWSRKSRWYW